MINVHELNRSERNGLCELLCVLLEHYCVSKPRVKGMKWGVRRYQNSDGSLTKEGKERFFVNAEDNK